MKLLAAVNELDFGDILDDSNFVTFREVLSDDIKRMVEVKIRGGAVLAKHLAEHR